jgi:hypothetical protein
MKNEECLIVEVSQGIFSQKKKSRARFGDKRKSDKRKIERVKNVSQKRQDTRNR